ncbi:MAG TPA: glycosyltransferase family 39 protein [Anaerolineales bacterium]
MQASVASGRLGRSARRLDTMLLAAIVIVFYLVYAVSPVTTSTDSGWTFHLAASILQRHSINLDPYRSLMDLRADYRLRQIDGHIYSYYPILPPLLVAPAVWIINALYPLRYPTDFYTYLATHAPDDRTARLEKLLASGLGALAAALIYLIARRELGVVKSLVVSAIFAFSTSMWSTATRALWQHGFSAVFLAGALYLVLLAREKPYLYLWIGIILGFSYLIRPTNSLAVAFTGLYILINYRRQVWTYAIGVAIVLLPFIALNWATYRNIFPPYSYQLFGRTAPLLQFLVGLAGTTVSPSRGLFVYSAFFLFSIYGAYLRLKGRFNLANFDTYLVAILITHWIIISLFEDWGGGWSIGPRYFVDVLPLLTYFLIPVFHERVLAAPGLRYTFVVAVVLSTLIQLHCATSMDPFIWNRKPVALVDAPQRKWDWGDLQFLRGFCPGNPLEGRAPACWLSPND